MKKQRVGSCICIKFYSGSPKDPFQGLTFMEKFLTWLFVSLFPEVNFGLSVQTKTKLKHFQTKKKVRIIKYLNFKGSRRFVQKQCHYFLHSQNNTKIFFHNNENFRSGIPSLKPQQKRKKWVHVVNLKNWIYLNFHKWSKDIFKNQISHLYSSWRKTRATTPPWPEASVLHTAWVKCFGT